MAPTGLFWHCFPHGFLKSSHNWDELVGATHPHSWTASSVGEFCRWPPLSIPPPRPSWSDAVMCHICGPSTGMGFFRQEAPSGRVSTQRSVRTCIWVSAGECILSEDPAAADGRRPGVPHQRDQPSCRHAAGLPASQSQQCPDTTCPVTSWAAGRRQDGRVIKFFTNWNGKSGTAAHAYLNRCEEISLKPRCPCNCCPYRLCLDVSETFSELAYITQVLIFLQNWKHAFTFSYVMIKLFVNFKLLLN